MGAKTAIEWTESTWNPIRAHDRLARTGWHCEIITPGCERCYAQAMNRRLGTGLEYLRKKRDEVDIFLDEKILTQPLRWRRRRRIFVCSMTDLFGDWVTDEMLDRIFAIMALCPDHTFQVLTKRPERMRDYCKSLGRHHTEDRVSLTLKAMAKAGVISNETACWYSLGQMGWYFSNVWAGVSVEDQRRADDRIPPLLDTPAAVRWVSAEPLLEKINIDWTLWPTFTGKSPPLNWVVVGGESGIGARPFDVGWARSIITQCRTAGVACFVKQIGAYPQLNGMIWEQGRRYDRKGGNPETWPADLRVREYPDAPSPDA